MDAAERQAIARPCAGEYGAIRTDPVAAGKATIMIRTLIAIARSGGTSLTRATLRQVVAIFERRLSGRHHWLLTTRCEPWPSPRIYDLFKNAAVI